MRGGEHRRPAGWKWLARLYPRRPNPHRSRSGALGQRVRPARGGGDSPHQHRSRRGPLRLRSGDDEGGGRGGERAGDRLRWGGQLRARGGCPGSRRSGGGVGGRHRPRRHHHGARDKALSFEKGHSGEAGGMKDEASTLMQAVAEVARRAGDVALSHFRKSLTIETKRDGTPVTVADREAESCARQWIEARFPEDGILGEEHGVHLPNAKRRWILDPIDGTKTFVRGVPLWGTLVAVAQGEEILAGAAYFPAVSEALVAAPGHGCWWSGARCSVSTISDLRSATVLVTDD